MESDGFVVPFSTKDVDWTQLAQVIAIAEKLGPGYTVFKDQGAQNYGICKTSDMPKNWAWNNTFTPSMTVIWDHDKEGNHINHQTVQAVLGKAQKRFVVYRVKARRV